MQWIEDQFEESKVDFFSKELNISKVLSKFLITSGIKIKSEAVSFLSPKLANLTDPFDINGLFDAVKRIHKAIEKNENILLVGDYDVDGITSTVIIKKLLNDFGLKAKYVIPKRKDEGYGLTLEVLSRGLENNEIQLVIALDCGTNSQKEAKFLQDRNIDLIVVDHHQAKERIAENIIQVNPHLKENKDKPWKFLCTAGLAFKLVHGLVKYSRKQGFQKAFQIDPKDFLSLSCLGTIADLVPLNHENRILAFHGLRYLAKNKESGLNALFKEAKLNLNKIESEDVSFKIAPRLNACGRLDSPEVAVSLLMEKNDETCSLLAKEIETFNNERKGIETIITQQALQQAEQQFSKLPAVVAFEESETWNPGVVGIVAGKLANLLNKPCVVLAKSGPDFKGSGRGVPGINLVKCLEKCKHLLVHWGGHPAAVGLTVKGDLIRDFRKKFTEEISKNLEDLLQEPSIKISTNIEKQDLNFRLIQDLNRMAPFGQGNPEPILAIKKIKLIHAPKKVGSGEHFQFFVNNGTDNISGIAWNMADRMPPVSDNLDLAFKLKMNSWNGRERIQMILEDWKLSD